MNTVTIQRKQTSFRLREDLLKILKTKAAQANRTLNNYVESVLLDNAYGNDPNAETRAAIEEAMSGENAGTLNMDSFDAFVNSINTIK